MAATYQGDSPTQSEADLTTQDATATGANRREHVRVRPDGSNRLAATLASGSDIRLIDLSRGGAQFECDRRFLPNATVSLRLLTSDGQVLVTGRVVRSRIVRLASGGLGYLVAVAFSKPLPNLGPDAPAVSPTASPTAAPVAAAPVPPPLAPIAPEAAVDPVAPIELVAPAEAVAAPPTPEAEIQADITAEEALAFEASIELAPAMLTVTASVDSTSEQLHDMFNGNDW